MQALRRTIAGLSDKTSGLQAIDAALYESMNSAVQFGVGLVVLLELVALIAEKLPEADELLPLFKAAITELSRACFERDCEKHGLDCALSLYRATIVSCEATKATMVSQELLVAINLVPTTCMPRYSVSVSGMSEFDAKAMEQAVEVACIKICKVVLEKLRK
jgi:hypothetical protein